MGISKKSLKDSLGVLAGAIDWSKSYWKGDEEDFYDKNPNTYEIIVEKFIKRKEVAKVLRELAMDVFDENPPQMILDGACGTGILTEELVKCVDDSGKIVGVDPAASAIKYAENTKNKKIEWREGDFHDLPIESGTVDFYSMHEAYRFADEERFWNEVFRVLKPGGMFAYVRSRTDMPILRYWRAMKRCEELGMEVEFRKLKIKGLVNNITLSKIIIVKKNA